MNKLLYVLFFCTFVTYGMNLSLVNNEQMEVNNEQMEIEIDSEDELEIEIEDRIQKNMPLKKREKGFVEKNIGNNRALATNISQKKKPSLTNNNIVKKPLSRKNGIQRKKRIVKEKQRPTIRNNFFQNMPQDRDLLQGICYGNITFVQEAIVSGADINCIGREGETPLTSSLRKVTSSKIAEEKNANLAIFNYLLQQNVDPNKKSKGLTPLFIYISEDLSCDTIVIRQLLDCGANPNLLNDKDYPDDSITEDKELAWTRKCSPLSFAALARKDAAKVVQLLFSKGAQSQLKDHRGLIARDYISAFLVDMKWYSRHREMDYNAIGTLIEVPFFANEVAYREALLQLLDQSNSVVPAPTYIQQQDY